MSKFPDWWKHGAKVNTKSGMVVTLNVAPDWEYWFTDSTGKEVYVSSGDILGEHKP